MDDVARWPAADRAELFTVVAHVRSPTGRDAAWCYPAVSSERHPKPCPPGHVLMALDAPLPRPAAGKRPPPGRHPDGFANSFTRQPFRRCLLAQCNAQPDSHGHDRRLPARIAHAKKCPAPPLARKRTDRCLAACPLARAGHSYLSHSPPLRPLMTRAPSAGLSQQTRGKSRPAADHV